MMNAFDKDMEVKQDGKTPDSIPYFVFESVCARYERYLKCAIFVSLALCVLFAATVLAAGLT